MDYRRGITFGELLTVLLVGLKLTGTINIPWILVVAPMLVEVAAAVLFWVTAFLVFVAVFGSVMIWGYLSSWRRRRRFRKQRAA